MNQREELKEFGQGLLLITILGIILMVLSFTLSSATLDLRMFISYLKSFRLIVMNIIPIIILLVALWLITNRIWLSFGIVSGLVFIGGMVNRTKLTYRDYPVIFDDLALVKESLLMAKEYKIPINTRIIISGIILILIIILLKKIDIKLLSKTRILSLVILVIISVAIFQGFYFDEALYWDIGDMEIINRWIEAERYQSKGFIYPFIYSMKDYKSDKPKNYDEIIAKERLDEYKYQSIPEDRKVNIISIMLEAYNDFSKYEGIEFKEDPYEEMDKIRAESAYGKLLTNVFAGGTINTERGFLTGYNINPNKHVDYNKKTNSFVWYLGKEGYRTEAMHPLTGSFYNRKNANEYLGFDKFDHLDNAYKDLTPQGEYLGDREFFEFIIEGYEESIKSKDPYFNFSVTYQNHGPYSRDRLQDTEVLKKEDNYNEGDYNIANNYFCGIKDTDVQIGNLIEYFREEDEPVVVVLFGDHNPWMGEDNSTYDMLDIDIDRNTIEGFKNYYETPYIIWGNDKAKEVTGKDMTGERETIGPNYLMAQLFEELGWEGDEYMQFITQYKRILPVQHHLYFKEDGSYKEELNGKMKDKWKDYLDVEYYRMSNFSYK